MMNRVECIPIYDDKKEWSFFVPKKCHDMKLHEKNSKSLSVYILFNKLTQKKYEISFKRNKAVTPDNRIHDLNTIIEHFKKDYALYNLLTSFMILENQGIGVHR